MIASTRLPGPFRASPALVAGTTDENRHGKTPTGRSVGNEFERIESRSPRRRRYVSPLSITCGCFRNRCFELRAYQIGINLWIFSAKSKTSVNLLDPSTCNNRKV